jgi:hypothetical protein
MKGDSQIQAQSVMPFEFGRVLSLFAEKRFE